MEDWWVIPYGTDPTDGTDPITRVRHNPHDPYDWEPTWSSLENQLDKRELSLPEFRQNGLIYQRLVGDELKKFLKCCIDEDVPEGWLQDTLIGNPRLVKYIGRGINVTSNSLRAAYFLHRISNYAEGQIKQAKELKVLEVGAGFGCFAELACRVLPITKYYFIDAPCMLTLQEYYMTVADQLEKCKFLLPHEEPPEQVDLIISSMSLAEMSEEELKKYLDLFKRKLVRETGLMYLVQRTEKAKIPWKDFNFQGNWKLETKPFKPMTHFTECFGRM